MSAAHIARGIRRTVLEQSKRANVGHIGSALSIADVLAALFDGPLADARPDDPDRNRLVLSKGHAALALYAALHACGRLSSEDLNTFGGDGTIVGGHPDHALPGIDFSTGSLGHGLSMAAGAALTGAGACIRHIQMCKIDLKISLGLAIGWIPAVLVAALLVKSMALENINQMKFAHEGAKEPWTQIKRDEIDTFMYREGNRLTVAASSGEG